MDADEWIRDSLSLFFEGEGCHLHALGTAEDGLEEFRKEHYDIIIADYRLPGMDGLEFLKRTKETHPDAMKILITAYGSTEVFRRLTSWESRILSTSPLQLRLLKSLCAG